MNLIEKLYYYSHQYWEDIADPRVNNFFVIKGGLWKILAIVGFYLFLINHLLPKYMKDRKPLKLNKILFLYNLTNVCLNIYGIYWSTISLKSGQILLDFEYPSREDYSPETKWFLTLGWVYMMSRLFEFGDTIFFVLRKKPEQITALHLYHHSIVPILCWLAFKHNGMIPFIRLYLLLNCTLHTFTYTYLTLSSVIPSVKTNFWLKRSIVQMEILQFIILGIYGSVLYCKQTGYPMIWFAFTVGQTPLLGLMFYNLYRKKHQNNKCLQKFA